MWQFVKVFGCRPTTLPPRTLGPASANLQGNRGRSGEVAIEVIAKPTDRQPTTAAA